MSNKTLKNYRFDFDEDFDIKKIKIAAEELYSFILSHETEILQLYKDPEVLRSKILNRDLSRDEIMELLECIEQKIR